MRRLAINTVGDELEAAAAFCRSEGIGIEVSDFAFPRILDGDLAAVIDRHVKAVAGIAPISMHGPFFELVASSLDPAIVAVARQRHEAALAAAARIGAAYYVANTNFTPLIRESSYRKNWARRMLDFWLPFADKAGRDDIIICLENVWEGGPDIQAELFAAANHPHLQATFDNGHALIFSHLPAKEWIKTLGPVLAHCHLHDNSGQLDEHKPVGEGRENWSELVAALDAYAPQAVAVAESNPLNNNKLSLDRLRKHFGA